MPSGLDQQGGVVEHEVDARSEMLGDPCRAGRRNARVEDLLEVSPCRRVVEHDSSEGVAIERAVGREDVMAEAPDHRVESVRTWLDDLPCDRVGVDDGCAALLETARDTRLAACDSASQAVDGAHNRAHGPGVDAL